MTQMPNSLNIVQLVLSNTTTDANFNQRICFIYIV